MIFTSLGLNYNLKTALGHLFGCGSQAASAALRDYLELNYSGQAELYYHGRAALVEAVRLSGAKQVVINGLTCWAVEEAVLTAGAQPVFADIDKAGYHFGLNQLKLVHQQNPQLGAIIVQATFGLPIALAPIVAYCRKHKISLIEDLAHSVGMDYSDGSQAGSLGDLVVFSFGRDKHLGTVNGGALVIRHQPQTAVRQQHSVAAKLSFRQRLQDRLYPVLACWLGLTHSWPGIGRLSQAIIGLLGLMSLSADGQPKLGLGLPGYKAKLALKRFQQLPPRRQHALQLWQIYTGRPAPKGANPIRCPIRLKQDLSLVLADLRQLGCDFSNQWLLTPVYPSRYFSKSAYRASDCPQAKTVVGDLIELPLHQAISPKLARRIAQIVQAEPEFKVVRPTAADWQTALESWPTSLNYLVSWLYGESLEATGFQVIRRLVYDKQRPVAAIQAVIRPARQGRHLEISGSPILADETDLKLNRFVIRLLRQLARQNQAAFVRFWPRLTDSPQRPSTLPATWSPPEPITAWL